jgi:4-hydroxy-L-threonine phosphate dehydrogenase PdxA
MSTYLITTGDADGIGLEVTLKALKKIKPKKSEKFVFFSERPAKKSAKLSKHSYPIEDSIHQALGNPAPIINFQSTESPVDWVLTAGSLCQQHGYAMITGPLSKQLISQSGHSSVGHTGLLKSLTDSTEVFMYFIGKYFNVALLTGHCQINEVTEQINRSKIELLVQYLKQFNYKKIALLGLNPHAGDDGVISKFDSEVLKPIVSKLGIAGPLVPDVAFMKPNWKKYDAYIACYHDQGLIPFKMIHGFESGVHISLGLPFVRTSVDHGTAKDIFGKNKAQYNSMLLAIKTAQRLSNK